MPWNLMQMPLLKAAVAVFLSVAASSSVALEFGVLKVHSSRGEPLLAEVAIQVAPADVLEPGCVKVITPGRKDVPAASGLSIFLRGNSASAVVDVRTPQIVDTPAIALALAANCGAGPSWREFLVQLKPSARMVRAANGREWVVMPGESPRALAQLLYPDQIGAQRRFIQALAEANPALGIDASGATALVAGSVLQMPDWKVLSGSASVGGGGKGTVGGSAPALGGGTEEAGQKRQSLAAAIAEPAPSSASLPPFKREKQQTSTGNNLAVPLRLSLSLSTSQEASEQLRQVLRLEYRLLTSFNEQLTSLAGLGDERLMREAPEASVAVPPPPSPPSSLPLSEPPAASISAPTLVAVPSALEAAPALPSSSGQQSETSLPPAKISPVKIRQASPSPQLPASTADGGIDWLTYGGLVAAALMLLALLTRRHPSVPVAATPADSEFPETVVVEHPVRAVVNVDAFFSQPDATLSKPLKPATVAAPDEKADVNPVMELAEIMLSFGRVEGAAQTLKEYIEANPKEALQPWVRLLDIYRTGDMHEQFDDLAQKLNRNFNVELQQWNAEVPPPEPVESDNPSKANSLEEIPHICEQIVSRWRHEGCLEYLHQLLRDNRGGQRSGFTLPVVQEILLLIEILLAHETSGRS